jgi:hypothetical protein
VLRAIVARKAVIGHVVARGGVGVLVVCSCPMLWLLVRLLLRLVMGSKSLEGVIQAGREEALDRHTSLRDVGFLLLMVCLISR